MRTKSKIIILVISFILLILAYLILDYYNVIGVLSLNVDRINFDLLSIFINNLIVIVLFLITYFLVDEKNSKARRNKKEIVKYMIEDDYKTVLRYLDILEDKTQLKMIMENINKDSYLIRNDYFNNWMDVSFKNYNDIMQYSSQGLIDVEVLKKYLYIRSNYSYTMSGYVLSVGMPAIIESLIEEGHEKLEKTIEEEIEKLDKYNWE